MRRIVNKDTRIVDYLSTATQRLKTDGFDVIENITYKDRTFEYVAKRTRWQLQHFGFAEFFFVFAQFSKIDWASLREFATNCF